MNYHFNTYDDTVDATPEISLYEYGLLRRTKDNKCLIVKNTVNGYDVVEKKPEIETDYITQDDIKNCLEWIDEGFYSYIDQTKEQVIKEIETNHLSILIISIANYYGWDSLDV